ncbi:Major facilitator superfamily domain, general substrate transporter [Penicillium occitanis (nom. inval.)]|nr:Major facilitator superfamily domain, general substrate transporter [Penicillium occitanis (nom. inval.)]PCG94446.1 hypothetical protein PENOC_082660 [Penicillium occitanis (nom. inval.)]
MSQITKSAAGRNVQSSIDPSTTRHDEKKFEDTDVGVTVLNGMVDELNYDNSEARKVVWKIDLFLLPLLAVTYMIQFLDKSCVSYAALWGMRTDAHLVGDQYSWLTTVFYLGYMAGELPCNILFQRFDIARTCGIFITLWGVVLLCMTAANNFAGLLTARLFLGILEAGRDEQPLRTCIWFSMNGMANILGGLIGYAIGYINAAIPAWKFPFVIFGSLTIVWGVIFTLLTPSNPTKARWLTQREKAIAVLRLAENETGIDTKVWKWEQVKEAFVDPRFWLMNLLTLANTIPNGGVSAFAPLIVNSFGFTKFQSTLLGMPSGASQVLSLWISGYLAMKIKGIRHFLMIGGLLVALLGASLIYALPDSNRVGRLLGYYLLIGFSTTFVLSISLVQSNVAGRTKKTIYNTAFFVSYCVGNLIGPQLFFAREAPRYKSGFESWIVCFVVQIVIVTVMYIVNSRENRKRDRFYEGNNNGEGSIQNGQEDRIALGLSDLTDMQNEHFRYVL